jgi:hypothetical protein
MKISIDFDHTLSEKQVQNLCRKFLKLGAEVWVVTSRSMKVLGKDTNNDDVYQVTDGLGIPRERVLFTAYEDKYSFVKDMDMHIDDSYDEIFLINQYPGKTIGFLYETKFHDNGIKEF